MTKEIVQVGEHADEIGALVWWTIRQGEYSVITLLKAARAAGLDDYVTVRIRGRDEKSAFIKATQSGARGIPVSTPRDREGKLITREATLPGDGGGLARALMYQETVAGALETKDIVTGKTAVVLIFNSRRGGFDAQWARWARDDQRIRKIVGCMQQDASGLIGTIDDGRIRSIVIGWLKQRHRVTVRGAGGVYFVPSPSDREGRDRLHQELLAMREWLGVTGSPFSIVVMTKGGALSIDDFVADATREITGELEAIAEKLEKWELNPAMNNGSVMFSSKTQAERLQRVAAKVEALKESLGEQIGVVDTMLSLLVKKAARLLEVSSRAVVANKEQRRRGDANQKATKRTTKKSGTAKARSKKVRV